MPNRWEHTAVFVSMVQVMRFAGTLFAFPALWMLQLSEQTAGNEQPVCSTGLKLHPPPSLSVCVCVCARYSTPWLRCGSRKHRRWTPVSSITAGRTSATCSTSGTWCWGECTRMLLTLALKTDHMLTSWPVYVSHYRFDFANSNVNDENLNKMNPHHVPDVVRLDSSVNKPGCPCSSSYC